MDSGTLRRVFLLSFFTHGHTTHRAINLEYILCNFRFLYFSFDMFIEIKYYFVRELSLHFDFERALLLLLCLFFYVYQIFLTHDCRQSHNTAFQYLFYLLLPFFALTQ